MTKFALIAIAGAAALSLAACENTKKQFDFSKKAPDEFAVVKRAPLEMPPDFEIRAPQPGAARPQELSASDIARSAVVGEATQREIAREAGVSEGEAVLLQRTGAVNASSSIRSQVDKETAEIADEKMPGIDHLRKMVGQTVEPPSKVVDPVAETNRLKQNKAEGKPLSTGKTPSVGD